MMKVVLKLDYTDDKIKQKVMRRVSGLSGLQSLSLDGKDKKLTLTGDIDAVEVVSKVRKLCSAEMVSVGPAKEPEKKKEDKKDEKKEGGGDGKKDEKKGEAKKDELPPWMKAAVPPPYNYYPYYHQQQLQMQPYHQPAPVMGAPAYYQHRSMEEDPTSCAIF